MNQDTNVKEQIISIWNQDCGDYDESYAHGIKSNDEKKEWLKLLDSCIAKKPATVLDVGAGTGFLSLLLCELGHRCKAIDLSEGMLAIAKKKAAKAGYTGLEFVIGDAEDTSEADNSYDVVINRHLVWTLPHPEKAISEWLRVLKPGGQLIIIDGDWFYNSFKNKLKVFLGKGIISCSEKRNAFKGSDAYSGDLLNNLPMMKSQNAKQLVEIVKRTGVKVEVRDAKAVEQAELKAMPLGYRLSNPYKRTVIIATKDK